MQYDLDEFDPTRLDQADRPGPGSYHFEVLEVEPEDPKTGALWADCEVLAGTTAGQEGKVHREYISNTPASVGRIMQFAVAIGLTTVDELKRLKAAGQSPEIDWDAAVGRQFCGRLEAEEYPRGSGKVRNKLNFNIWSVDSPKAKGIPLHRHQLAEFRQMNNGDDPFGAPADSAGDTKDSQSLPFGGADDLF